MAHNVLRAERDQPFLLPPGLREWLPPRLPRRLVHPRRGLTSSASDTRNFKLLRTQANRERRGPAAPPGRAPGRLMPFETRRRMADVPGNEIDAYLDALEEPKRSTLARLRDMIMAIVPDAEQCISYGMPAFRLRGKTVAGFAAFKNHLSYLPHSGSVIPQLGKELEGYTSTRGSLHFPVDQPLPEALVRKLLAVRMAEAFGGR
jgi:uncharacterized protein YdhG (YjbR/CyaY superfamily)